MLFYAVIFICILVIGLIMLWRFIEAYEKTRASTAMQAYMEDFSEDKVYYLVYDFLGTFDNNIQPREEIFNEPTPPQSMEECLLRGMLPGYANKSVELEQRFQELVRFVPLITNWSICDSCCATYKFARENREHLWDFLQPYLYSEKEFEARFGLVMLLNHFIQQEEWVARIVGVLPSLPCKGYYAEMAAAWLLCEIHLRYPTLAATLLAETTPLSPAIRNRALRKIRESARKG